MENIKGLVFNIQRYSVHDGAGIRTNVFLKGCPLKCEWCANPESQAFHRELVISEKDCMHCGACYNSCQTGALTLNGWDREKCIECEACTDICPTGARKFIGKLMTPLEVKKEILKDSGFYRTSGGGVTFSGGEALSQSEFVEALAVELKKDYITMAIETSGYAPWEKAEKVLIYMNEILYDIKHMDSTMHKKLVGVGNELILENARRAAQLNSKFIVRVPVIGGKNNDFENIYKTGLFAKEIGADELHLLPYHRFGESKYNMLKREYLCDAYTPSDEEMEKLKTVIGEMNLECHIGG